MSEETKNHIFTEEDIDACWQYYKSYLVDILNGQYQIDQARDDLHGLIGSDFDKRMLTNKNK